MQAHDEADYAALVDRALASPASHTLAYRDVLSACGLGQPHYLLARQGERLQGALPAFVKRSPIGGVLNSLPLVQSAGGAVFCPDLTAAERGPVATSLYQAMIDWAKAQAVNVCVVIGTPYPHEGAEPIAPDFSLARTTHLLDLRLPLRPHHAAKEALRKASKVSPSHHVATSKPQAKQVWSLYAQNMERLGVVPRAWPFYEQLYERAPSCARFVWAEVGNEPVCGLVLLRHRDVVDYHSVGNTPQGRKHQISTWLCVQELMHAQAEGALWWNWGVSPTAAVAAFKRSFGGFDQSYPIWGWLTGNVEAWRALSPAALAKHFPDHFVLPYDWLAKDSA